MSTARDYRATPHLVLVTGAGRSGTSTVAGALARLGFHLPEPVLAANESNPRGFYESWWPVRYHTRLMKRANIAQTDGRPDAGPLMAAAVNDQYRQRLRSWLAEQLAGRELVVVKDPRAAWVPDLWFDTATELGAELGYVTMLRHPSEVISSRSTYYAANRPGMAPREFAIWTLCGWINQNLTLERRIRDHRRVLLRYVDLLQEWRPALDGLLADLALPKTLLTSAVAAEIDDFIEPRLRRHDVDWGELELPPALVDLAEQAWDGLVRLGDRHGHDPDAERTLDAVSERYASLYADAAAIAYDHTSSRANRALKRGRRQGREQAERAQAEARRARRLTARARRAAGAALRRVRPARRT
ncbi:MAG: hypothetical protein L0H24_08640 [Microlunatus sp.]|nr:hypothetical protein [Microlunatus sp.]